MKTPRFITRTSTYLVVLGLLSMVACKKKDVEPTDGVQGNWQMTSVKFDPAYVISGIPVTDLLAIYAL